VPQLGYVLLGLFFILANGVIYGMLFAILGARFRDIAVIIQNLIQVAFFLTPIMWMDTLLPERYKWVLAVNPFAQFTAVLREPLTGHAPSLYTICFNFGFIVMGMILVFLLFQKVRSRIVYWI
jgi:lipopolysaccharide transport system permease protein